MAVVRAIASSSLSILRPATSGESDDHGLLLVEWVGGVTGGDGGGDMEVSEGEEVFRVEAVAEVRVEPVEVEVDILEEFDDDHDADASRPDEREEEANEGRPGRPVAKEGSDDCDAAQGSA